MKFEEIRNFLALSENLYTGGMPKAGQLADAAEHGVEVVINLAPHDAQDALPNEAELANSLGIHYVNIPVDWNAPTGEDLDRFMDTMDEFQGKKILVHCQANYRASAFVSMYQILREGWTPEAALGIMHQIWSEEDYPVWKKFIEESIEDQ